MNNKVETSHDGTVMFLPERLNRDPTVIRGMTADEMFVIALIGVVLGLGLGILLWIVTSEAALIVTSMFLIGPVLCRFFGSSLLRRMKRGRPNTWVYRAAQYRLAKRGINIGIEALILRSGNWSIRRENRHRQALLKLLQQDEK